MRLYVADKPGHTSLSVKPWSERGFTAFNSEAEDEVLNDEGRCIVARSSHCPFAELHSTGELTALRNDPPTPHCQVAVVTICQDSSKRVLLARRSRAERSTPGAWVMPGTVVKEGERLVEAAIRGLKEDTSLDVVGSGFGKMKLVGAWEGVFPFDLSRGSPQAHSLVFYFIGHCVDAAMLELDADLDACAWVGKEEADLITGLQKPRQHAMKVPRRMYGWETSSGDISATSFSPALLQEEYPNRHGQGLLEGDRVMLQEWSKHAWYEHTYTKE